MDAQNLILTILLCLFGIACYSQVNSTKKNKTTNSSDKLEGKKHYINPVDQKMYSTEGEFKTYYPEGEVKIKVTELDHVVLLNGDDELNESIDIDGVALLIENIKTIFQKYFAESKGSGRIMIQVNIFKDKEFEFQYATQENIDLEMMTAFEKEMRGLKTINSRKYEIVFQLVFRVNLIPEE